MQMERLVDNNEINLDDEWLKFMENSINDNNLSENALDECQNSDESKLDGEVPKCGPLYISTTTKLTYLNTEIPIYELFWKLPVINYWEAKEGIVKKSIKINCDNEEQTKALDKNILQNNNHSDVMVLKNINEKKGSVLKYKDVRKIDIGLCKKDINSCRKKKKGAFYNCFALIIRIKLEDTFKELHVKVFNTGKLEIPGIQSVNILYVLLDKLREILVPYLGEGLNYKKSSIHTVLINSNFVCGFYINRNKLFDILKYNYNMNSNYDPCSYPGIQCKFYINKINDEHLLENMDGKCNCEVQCGKTKFKKIKKEKNELDIAINNLKKKIKKSKKKIEECKKETSKKKYRDQCEEYEEKLKEKRVELEQLMESKKSNCTEMSFMIFRTGSILIVGHCDEDIVGYLYDFISNLLKKEYFNIKAHGVFKEKQKKNEPKSKKRIVYFTTNNNDDDDGKDDNDD